MDVLVAPTADRADASPERRAVGGRLQLLAGLLAAQLAFTLVLTAFGAFGVDNDLQWSAAVLLASLPLVIGLWVIARRGFRFTLRTMLIASTLVAIFMGVGVWPLYDALASRRGTQALVAEQVRFRHFSSNDQYFVRIKYDPRRPPLAAPQKPLPPWLRPLASKAMMLPTDAAVRELTIDDDAQAAALAEHATRFRSLAYIGVRSRHLSPRGIQLLRETLPQVQELSQLSIAGSIPQGLVSTAPQVRSLWISSWGRQRGRLSRTVLTEIAALPELGHLYVQGIEIGESDLQLLAQSASLRRVVLLTFNASEAAVDRLRAAMPACEISTVPLR